MNCCSTSAKFYAITAVSALWLVVFWIGGLVVVRESWLEMALQATGRLIAPALLFALQKYGKYDDKYGKYDDKYGKEEKYGYDKYGKYDDK